MPVWSGLLFQDSLSFNMERITFFHDYSMIFVIFICVVSAYFIFSCLVYKSFDIYFMESQDLELFWIFLPSIILIVLAVPSMKVLYFIEELYSPMLSFKTIGHQWFWSYEEPLMDESLDSFMSPAHIGRLLKTNKILMLPVQTSLRNMVSSSDVIHSWAVPSVGLKVDATPGRLSQVFLFSNFNSLLVGQCSEICGANHSFMPIIISFC